MTARLVGASPPRPDGLARATGAAQYADDIPVEGLWYGATVRSPHPHARVHAVRWRDGQAPDGAVLVTASDLPGPNGVLLVDDSWPILAAGECRHVGEPVALVAASTREDAERARQAVEVAWEPLDAVTSLEAAAVQPPLHTVALQCGDVDDVFSRAPLVVEGEYRTGYQEHLYLECQGMTAHWEPDGSVVLTGSMQCPYYVRKAVSHAFAMPPAQVCVQASAVGGGFGGKEDFPSLLAIHAALLARAAGGPVRIVYDRQEDIIGTTKRHPSVVRHRTAVDSTGRLEAMDIEIEFDGGAYLTLSSVVISRAALHATGPYRCPNVRIRGVVRRTDTPPNGAFRGFGAPQVAFAVERQMDRIARRLGLDPYEIRARNALAAGDRLPTGQVLDDDASARQCLDTVVAKTRFRERWREHEASREVINGKRRGVGLSLYFHGAGFTGNGERMMHSPVTVRLRADGRIEVCTIATDIGQGASIALAQMAADAAGVVLEDVAFTAPDTRAAPDSGPTVASRTTMIVGGTVAAAISELRDRVLDWWRANADEAAEGVAGGLVRSRAQDPVVFRDVVRRCFEQAGPLEVTRRHEPPAWQVFDEASFTGAAYGAYSWGADVAEVEVDPDTLETRALGVTAVCEVGTPIHPMLCAGQVEGGTLQAVGYALIEDVTVHDGRVVNDRLSTCLAPTFMDAPEIAVELITSPLAREGSRPKGVGELPMDGGAPAIAAAIENATGLVPAALPVTPERLLELDGGGRA